LNYATETADEIATTLRCFACAGSAETPETKPQNGVTMKILIWAVAVLLALLATATVWVLTSITGWIADNSAGALGSVAQMAQWPVPAWLAVWIDPGLLESLYGRTLAFAQWMATFSTPWVSTLLGWLEPALWVLWGLFMALLLALASGLHYLAHRHRAAL
jgi:hypothetical protein